VGGWSVPSVATTLVRATYTTKEMNFRDVATIHSVAGVFFARCAKSHDLP